MRLYIFSLILACFFFLSCEKEVEINLPDYNPKIAIDGWIEQDKPAQVHVTLSSPFITRYDSLSIMKTFLNFSKVTITSNSGEKEVLTLYKKDDIFPPFVFKSVSIKGKVGETYHLEILTRGQKITATTTIPEPPEILNAHLINLSDTTGYIEAFYNDPPNERNFYFISTKTVGFQSDYCPSYNPVFSDKHFNGDNHIAHNIYRGNAKTILEYSDPKENRYKDIKGRAFLMKDTIIIKCCSIDSTSFEVLNSVFIDLTSVDNPFRSETSAIKTNIIGGIGRWTGLGTKYILVTEDLRE